MTNSHPIEQLETIVVIAIGGFAGSNLRYFFELSIPNSLLATGTMNVLGCLALGFIFYDELYSDSFSGAGQTLLATGLIASFTTYSTFIVDTALTAPSLALLYVGLSYSMGFLAVLIGRMGAKHSANKWSKSTVSGD